jgi:hypothetical protein
MEDSDRSPVAIKVITTIRNKDTTSENPRDLGGKGQR